MTSAVYRSFVNTPMGFKTVYALPEIGSGFGYRLIMAGYFHVSDTYN